MWQWIVYQPNVSSHNTSPWKRNSTNMNPLERTWLTATTTRNIGSTTTITRSVSGTTVYWSTSKFITTIKFTVSNIATATQVETKVVTVTETPGASTASATPGKRAAYGGEALPTTVVNLRCAQPDSGGNEPVADDIYYIREAPHLDILADALAGRGLSILRRATVTSTAWITNSNTQWSTVTHTRTDWRVLTSTTTSTETSSSTSYYGAATTVTSTTTSTTRILAGTTPTDSSSPSPTPTPEANTDNNSSRSSPPIGPIVGGSVGGVAAIALLGAIIFIVKRRRHWAEQDAAADSTTVGRASTLGMPEGNPDGGFTGGPGRGAVAEWTGREPKLPVLMPGTGTPSSISGPTSGAGSEMGAHHPYAPYSENGDSPGSRALSGHWYPPPPPVPMQQPQPPTAPTHYEMGATPAPMQTQQPQAPQGYQQGMSASPVEEGVYVAQRQNLGGQWYPHPAQQAREMDGRQIPGELPGHNEHGGHGTQRY